MDMTFQLLAVSFAVAASLRLLEDWIKNPKTLKALRTIILVLYLLWLLIITGSINIPTLF